MHSRLIVSWFPWLAALAVGLAPSNARAQRTKVDFSRDIRSIFSNNCYKCHGPDDKQRQAGLRLDMQEGAFAALPSGSMAIVPGKSDASALYARITSNDPDQRMPPPASGKTLTEQQIQLIKTWIDEGATWRGHWAFIAPQRPEPPAVQHTDLVRNPIDQFILSRVEEASLQPAGRADPVTLLRRVTLDLTGLPPTLAEVDAFLADTSPEAYERVVDRLLASPRFGEHMARYWLDAARYGDTHGLHFDNERSLWPYRDWVIQAFNANMPFDQFATEQLAGDLLPNPTVEQQIATGFNRCNVSTSEGGSIDAEVLVRYAVDRVETTSTVFLGLTAGCAVCHDHKFDPLTQRDFYRLFAYFASSADQAMDGNQLSPTPIVKTPQSEQTAKEKALNDELVQVREQISRELAGIEYVEPAPSETVPTPEYAEYVWIEDALPAEAKPTADGGEWQFVGQPEHPVFSGDKSTTRTAQGTSQHFFTDAKPGLRVGEGDKLFAYVFLDPANPPQEVMLQFNDGSWEHRAIWGGDLIAWGAAGSPSRFAAGGLPKAGEWVRLEVDCAQVGLGPGSTIHGWAFTQFDGTVHWDKAGIVTRTAQGEQSFTSQLAWEGYLRTLSKPEVPQPVQDAARLDPPARDDAQRKLLRDYFLEHVFAPTKEKFVPFHARIAELDKGLADLAAQVPVSMIMQDMTPGRDTFILSRGAYDKPGEKVDRGVPAFLPPLPADAPQNRLGLARWLVDPAHPLTARVTVNRLWQQLFGTGIVKTAEDFGSQGQWPTHPELLDWLATEFIGSNWNVKGMLKLLVMSNTYCQSSHMTPEAMAHDSANELLARGPRFRLDAEVIRDAALSTAGLLVERLGGHSVKPYQPDGLWEAVGFVGSNTSIYVQDSGDALYRRSMYTFWKRTSPPASLSTFDAPSRETCSVRRARTNTPLQALVLLNDKQFLEAARKLAERVMKEAGSTPHERLTLAFRLATARTPSANELAVLVRDFESHLAAYRADVPGAEQLLSYGDSPRDMALDAAELAAYTMTSSLIMNLDETVTKE